LCHDPTSRSKRSKAIQRLCSCAEPNSIKLDSRATWRRLIHTPYLGRTKLRSLQVQGAWVQAKLRVLAPQCKNGGRGKYAKVSSHDFFKVKKFSPFACFQFCITAFVLIITCPFFELSLNFSAFSYSRSNIQLYLESSLL